MKPEKDSDEMEDCVCDPIELFIDIGMLIVEGRIPDLSPKRRIEGPHCPTLDTTYDHRCDRHREQCRRADQLRKQMLLLCRNKIPMRVDVLLLPKCDHGQLEASTTEGATVSCQDTAMLLERWDVQIIPKRLDKTEIGCVTGRFLLQALRSYLHFSQLSSWMITSGYLPFEVIYRLYAPGETVNYSFKVVPAVHNFPQSEMNHATMKVSVASVPRPQEVPNLTCLNCDKGRQQKFDKFPKGRTASRPSTSHPERPHSSKSLGLDQYKLKSLESHHTRKKSCDKASDQSGSSRSDKLDGNLCPSRPKSPRVSDEDDCSSDQSLRSGQSQGSSQGQSSPGKKSLYHKPPSGRKLTSPIDGTELSCDLTKDKLFSMQSEGPGASQGTSHRCYAKKLLKESLKEKPLSFRHDTHSKLQIDPDTHSKHYIDPDTLVKRLPSPKVLFTTNPKSQTTTYKKRRLDLDDLSENVEDKIMSSNISDLMKPLHSEELESYLSSLSHRLPEKAIHDNIHSIPLTKCKFFIGDENGSTSKSDKKSNSECSHGNEYVVENSNPGENVQSDGIRGDVVNTGSLKRETTGKNSPDNDDVEAFQYNVTAGLNNVQTVYKTDPQKSDLETSGCHGDENTKQKHSGHTSKESVTRCLFKSLSEPGPDLEKLSLSMGQDGIHSYGLSHDGFHGYRSSHDGSPNGLMFTDDESSDNSTPTNSLSDNYTNNVLSHKPTSDKGRESNGLDSLEKEIANLKLAENNCSPKQTDRNDKVALGKSLCKHLMTKELTKLGRPENISMPNQEEIRIFQKNLDKSASMMFNTATGLPSRSSPAPTKRKSGRFDYDNTLISAKAIKNALSCSKLALQSESSADREESQKVLSTSAPASTNCLLGNFEESVLNGRIEPVGVVEGFTAEIGAGGSFCPKHITLPVTAYFFQLSDDNAPSPYLGHINLESLGKKGYKIPTCGTVQVTLFNPNKTVVKMFVVMYDLSDMPANCQTFLRQRTVYMPADPNSTDASFLRYLIHLRFVSSKTGKIYLHTDIRLIFARDKFEFDPRVANYELRSFTEGPQNPKFSPKR